MSESLLFVGQNNETNTKRERPVIPYSSPDDMKKRRNEVASRGFKQESRKEVKTNEAQNSTTSETAAGKANIKKREKFYERLTKEKDKAKKKK